MEEKSKRILHVALALLLISPPPAESLIFTAIMSAVEFAYQAYQVINDAHDTYKKFAPQTTLDDVLDQAKKVEEKVDQIGAQLSNQINQAVGTIITQVDIMNNIREGMGRISQGIRRIDSLYRLFELYTSKKIVLSNSTLKKYIDQVTTVGPQGPRDILGDIHDVIIPGSGLTNSLLFYLQQQTPKNDKNSCGTLSTGASRLYEIFRLIMVAEVRAFSMLAFSYSLDQVFQCESFKGELQLSEYELRDRAQEYYETFSNLLSEVGNTIRTCDAPGGWVKGENYYEFDRFKSNFIASANTFYEKGGKCEAGCQYGKTKTIKNCEKDFGCVESTTCKGQIIECQIMSSTPATLCELGPEGKRYQYIETSIGQVEGDKGEGCRGNIVEVQKKNDCEVCWCVCIEDDYDSLSLRTVSLRPQLADVEENKVVTGIRFYLKEEMIHIMIQQGQVLPEGRIVAGTAEWKDIEPISFSRNATQENKALVYSIQNDDGSDYPMEENEDFIAFNYESHRIYIDDLIVPRGYIVTGVRFNKAVADKTGSSYPIQLEIHATPYDYETGTMGETDDNPSMWLTPSDMKDVFKEYSKDRKRLWIIQADNPATRDQTNTPNSTPNSYIDLGSTSTSSDGGQETLPFLDAQEVAGKPPFAAGGIGLYQKSYGTADGGFLGFRLYGLDSMKNLRIEALDMLDEYSDGVDNFQGCSDKIE